MSEGSTQESVTRVTLSFDPGDEETAAALDAPSYRAYLRRAHQGPVAVGETWEEFIGRGCGNTRDVTLRVAATDGGEVIDEATEFVFDPASA